MDCVYESDGRKKSQKTAKRQRIYYHPRYALDQHLDFLLATLTRARTTGILPPKLALRQQLALVPFIEEHQVCRSTFISVPVDETRPFRQLTYLRQPADWAQTSITYDSPRTTLLSHCHLPPILTDSSMSTLPTSIPNTQSSIKTI
jgi:hypothetical protein